MTAMLRPLSTRIVASSVSIRILNHHSANVDKDMCMANASMLYGAILKAFGVFKACPVMS
jgi:hypothetical protein